MLMISDLSCGAGRHLGLVELGVRDPATNPAARSAVRYYDQYFSDGVQGTAARQHAAA